MKWTPQFSILHKYFHYTIKTSDFIFHCIITEYDMDMIEVYIAITWDYALVFVHIFQKWFSIHTSRRIIFSFSHLVCLIVIQQLDCFLITFQFDADHSILSCILCIIFDVNMIIYLSATFFAYMSCDSINIIQTTLKPKSDSFYVFYKSCIITLLCLYFIENLSISANIYHSLD